MDWQEGFFGGVNRIEFMLLCCWVCERKTLLKLPFAVACNFLKVFSFEDGGLELCLGPKLAFRCCVLYSGFLNLHVFCHLRNCIFYKHFWQTGKVVISPGFLGMLHEWPKLGFSTQHPKNHHKLLENSIIEIDTKYFCYQILF